MQYPHLTLVYLALVEVQDYTRNRGQCLFVKWAPLTLGPLSSVYTAKLVT